MEARGLKHPATLIVCLKISLQLLQRSKLRLNSAKPFRDELSCQQIRLLGKSQQHPVFSRIWCRPSPDLNVLYGTLTCRSTFANSSGCGDATSSYEASKSIKIRKHMWSRADEVAVIWGYRKCFKMSPRVLTCLRFCCSRKRRKLPQSALGEDLEALATSNYLAASSIGITPTGRWCIQAMWSNYGRSHRWSENRKKMNGCGTMRTWLREKIMKILKR